MTNNQRFNNTIKETGWAIYDMPSEVAPINDLKPHEIGAKCWCNPFRNVIV